MSNLVPIGRFSKISHLSYLDRLLRRPLDQLIPYAIHVKTVTAETSLTPYR